MTHYERRSRPRKFTPARAALAAAVLNGGGTMTMAATAVGATASAVRYWLQRGAAGVEPYRLLVDALERPVLEPRATFCLNCDAPLPRSQGRGRPPKYCGRNALCRDRARHGRRGESRSR